MGHHYWCHHYGRVDCGVVISAAARVINLAVRHKAPRQLHLKHLTILHHH